MSLCKSHLTKYLPSYYLFPHGAFQALWNVYGARDTHWKLTYERDYIKMNDGGTLSIDWAYPSGEEMESQEVRKVVIIFPGLSGHSHKGYVKSLAKHLSQDCGYIVGVFHNRGVSQEFTSPVLPDICSSEEINTAIQHMVKKQKHENKRTYFSGIGMSMGANLMMKIAGEQGDNFALDAMVSLNNPFDIWLAINLMRGKPYEKFLAIELKNQLINKKKISKDEELVFKQMAQKFGIDFKALSKISTWRDWDEQYTKKAYRNYPTLADYYFSASSLPLISKVKRPTLVIHSKDDPIIPIECLPVNECLSNPHMIVGIVEKGGHVCYFQGVKGQKRWYPLVSGEFLDALIELRERQRVEREEAEKQLMYSGFSTNSQSV
ncbi:hypothetical protein FGO68_gene12092 [Halteria grandinella]|uniref:AB hydrolase-1 domain-containing protein n=1 Tax=Halteria grandinella TaxID=5974 RepID=A0A8J8NNL6_HALGN|nr:hypothetical protein FGO68_gene12092 [Halteria grandinella]